MTDSFDRNRFEQNLYNALSDLAQTMDILGQRQQTTEQNLNTLTERVVQVEDQQARTQRTQQQIKKSLLARDLLLIHCI